MDPKLHQIQQRTHAKKGSITLIPKGQKDKKGARKLETNNTPNHPL